MQISTSVNRLSEKKELETPALVLQSGKCKPVDQILDGLHPHGCAFPTTISYSHLSRDVYFVRTDRDYRCEP